MSSVDDEPALSPAYAPAASYTVARVQTRDDLERVWAFAVPILDLPTGVHTLAYYTEQLARDPDLLVYAEREGRVAGCILASIEGDHVLVGPVAVAADARRMGIGSAMMQEVERQALAIGQATLILGSVEEAEPFYLSCGFQPHLFIQVPESGALDRFKALNLGYEVAWEAVEEGWTRLMLRTPAIDKPLQRRYEDAFPGCYTQVVFIKHLARGSDG